MKSNFLILILVLIFSVNLKAQITKAVIEQREIPVGNSIKYNGYSNICEQKKEIDYQQYKGLKAYLIKDTPLSTPDNEQFALSKSNYFTIIEIQKNGRNYGGDRVDFKLKLEGSEQIFTYSTELNYCTQNDGNDSTPDFLYLVDYFLNLKKIHDDEEYVIVNTNGKFYDESTKQEVEFNKPLYNGVWKCEVNMYEQINYYGDSYERLSYFLSDSVGHVVVNGFNMVNKLEEGDGGRAVFYSGGSPRVMPLKLFNKAVEAENIRKENATKNVKKSYQTLIAKYGNENAQLISKGKVRVGMTTEMCEISWNDLYGIISQTQNSSGTYQVWKHALYGTKLYFKNKKVYKIMD